MQLLAVNDVSHRVHLAMKLKDCEDFCVRLFSPSRISKLNSDFRRLVLKYTKLSSMLWTMPAIFSISNTEDRDVNAEGHSGNT